MGDVLSFIKRHLIPAGGLIIAALTWGYGVVSGAHEIATAILASWQWQLVGGAVFILSVLAILFQWDKSRLAGEVLTSTEIVRPTHEKCDANEVSTQEPAPQPLIDFALDYVYPTWIALTEIQQALIARECRNDIIRGFAIAGIESNPAISTFAYGLHGLGRFGTSPPQSVTKDEMIGYVHALETGYQAVLDQTQLLAVAAGTIDLATHPDFAPMFERWRLAHNAMVAAFEPIKRDRAFDKLFRPIRPSRWGGPIEPLTAVGLVPQSVPLKFYSQKDKENLADMCAQLACTRFE